MSWRNSIRILIVEDDESVGASLQDALTRHGYSCTFVSKPNDALNLVRSQSFNAAILDCMLPQKNGVDLSLSIKESLGESIPIVLMSGIFKDKAFVKDSIQQTGAIAFLIKPFDLEEVQKLLDNQFENKVAAAIDPLHELVSNSGATARSIQKSIEALDRIHGFDLPLLFSFLMETNSSGHFNIVSDHGIVSGITFAKGKITHVDVKDSESFMGRLLIEKGFISAEDLQRVEMQNSTKRIGDRLVEACLLSPHAIPVVLAEQMILRLSKVIGENSVKINFSQTTVEETEPNIDLYKATPYLNDWINSKISDSWLKSFYRGWYDYKMSKGPNFQQLSHLNHMSLLKKVPEVVQNLNSGQASIQTLLDSTKANEMDILRSVHLLAMRRVILFEIEEKGVNAEKHTARLTKLGSEIEGKDPFQIFEVLGTSRDASKEDLNRIYREMSKFLHPDRLGANAGKDLKELASSIFSKISDAYKILNDDREREKYLKEVGVREAQKHLEFEALFDQGKTLLKRQQIAEARAFLDKAETVDPQNKQVKLYQIWAKIKSASGRKISPKTLQDMETHLSQVPPEDRHSSIYYFVKGLHQTINGQNQNAIKNFELALTAEPDFLEARRELNLLKLGGKKEKTVFTEIGNLFKKKA